MLVLYLNILDYIYNNIFYFYNIYIVIYKFSLLIRFNLHYKYNILKYYIIFNRVINNILKIFILIYFYLKKILLWLNRRFLKKKKDLGYIINIII